MTALNGSVVIFMSTESSDAERHCNIFAVFSDNHHRIILQLNCLAALAHASKEPFIEAFLNLLVGLFDNVCIPGVW